MSCWQYWTIQVLLATGEMKQTCVLFVNLQRPQRCHYQIPSECNGLSFLTLHNGFSLPPDGLDFGMEDPELDSKVRSTIGIVVLPVNPLPPSAVAELIGMETKQVMMILTLVQSLSVLNEDLPAP